MNGQRPAERRGAQQALHDARPTDAFEHTRHVPSGDDPDRQRPHLTQGVADRLALEPHRPREKPPDEHDERPHRASRSSVARATSGTYARNEGHAQSSKAVVSAVREHQPEGEPHATLPRPAPDHSHHRRRRPRPRRHVRQRRRLPPTPQTTPLRLLTRPAPPTPPATLAAVPPSKMVSSPSQPANPPSSPGYSTTPQNPAKASRPLWPTPSLPRSATRPTRSPGPVPPSTRPSSPAQKL